MNDYQEIISSWNDMARECGLPEVRVLSPARRVHLRRRVEETSAEDVLMAIGKIARSDFCRGKNGRGWKADFDFLCQAKSFPRILEGFYDNRTAPRPTYRNGAMEWLAQRTESIGEFPTIDNTTMIAGDD